MRCRRNCARKPGPKATASRRSLRTIQASRFSAGRSPPPVPRGKPISGDALAGRLLAERVISDGGACPLGNNLMKVAELEFAFRMAEDLPPRDMPWDQDEVLDRVATLHPAIELPDSRYNQFERAGLAQLIADNACAHRFILGPAAGADWRGLNLAQHKAHAAMDGADAGEGVGANVLGDPRIALTWLVNELSRHGLTLKAGEVASALTAKSSASLLGYERLCVVIQGAGVVDDGPSGRARPSRLRRTPRRRSPNSPTATAYTSGAAWLASIARAGSRATRSAGLVRPSVRPPSGRGRSTRRERRRGP